MRNVIVNTGTAEEYSARGREIAQKIDRGETLEAEVTLTFEDPGDMFAVMTPARLELFGNATGERNGAWLPSCQVKGGFNISGLFSKHSCRDTTGAGEKRRAVRAQDE